MRIQLLAQRLDGGRVLPGHLGGFAIGMATGVAGGTGGKHQDQAGERDEGAAHRPGPQVT